MALPVDEPVSLGRVGKNPSELPQAGIEGADVEIEQGRERRPGLIGPENEPPIAEILDDLGASGHVAEEMAQDLPVETSVHRQYIDADRFAQQPEHALAVQAVEHHRQVVSFERSQEAESGTLDGWNPILGHAGCPPATRRTPRLWRRSTSSQAG